MKVDVLDLQGKPVKKVELPSVFKTEIRPDLVQRAFLALMSHKRQPYGTDPLAGLRTSAHYHGRRHTRYTMMNRELARMPRLHGDTAPGLFFRVRKVPQAVKGRRAHPPKVEKVWEEKINKKEKKLAILSSIASTKDADKVRARGHRFRDDITLPVVVEDKFKDLSKTKDVMKVLEKIGVIEDIERAKNGKKIRAGKGKRRGRKYKVPKSILIVSNEGNIFKSARNLPGVDIVAVSYTHLTLPTTERV